MASLALASTEWTAIGSSVVGLLALGLSSYSLWRQRATPYLEAQFVYDLGTGTGAVTVRNDGSGAARAPWVMFDYADGAWAFAGHVGRGFLAPGEVRYVVTSGRTHDRKDPGPPVVIGIVGHRDRRGRHVVRNMNGGRARRFRGTRSFRDLFEIFHRDSPIGPQVGIVSDVPGE